MTQVATEASPCAQPQNTGFSHDLTCFKAARCTRLCKIFGLNRTKMFHVKHFGTICLEQYEKVQQLRTFVRQTVAHDICRKICEFPPLILQKGSALFTCKCTGKVMACSTPSR
jgi:hypothetical protein